MYDIYEEFEPIKGVLHIAEEYKEYLYQLDEATQLEAMTYPKAFNIRITELSVFMLSLSDGNAELHKELMSQALKESFVIKGEDFFK